MNAKFEVDYEQLEEYVKWLLSFRIGGIAVNVDTGEGPLLSTSEKLRILEVVKEYAKGRTPIIAGLQARSTLDAIRVARDFKRVGADALLVFPHSAFIGRPNVDIIYHYHREIERNVKIPLIIFQLQPALGGVEFDAETLLKLVELKSVIAIKEASFDAKKFVDTVRILRRAPRKITILTGNDNFIYESLILGAEGGLLGFGTIAIDRQVEMFEHVAKGDYERAKEIWEELLPLVDIIFAEPVRNYRARLKVALMMMGILKTAYVRPPLLDISKEEKERLRKTLVEVGLL